MKMRDYRTLFSNAPDALLLVERETLAIVDANRRACELFGRSEEELRATNVGKLLNPAGCARLSMGTAPPSAAAEIADCAAKRPDNTTVPVDVTVSQAPEGGLVIVALHDATEKAKMRDQLRQAQKMEAVGMLAGGIAHDFNNLLTIISGYTQMLMISPQLTTERDRTALEQVLRASERAADLTTQLLAFSRRQTVQPRVIELNRIVDQTASMLQRLIGEDIELQIEKSPDAGRIHADPAQMQQVLLNLVINARDAMPGGGTLVIRTRNSAVAPRSHDRHNDRGHRRGGYVVLEICDTGTGIDAATREKIFEPFFTTKPEGKGTGLGLSTVYAIVKQAHGTIDLHTEVGHGATFSVYLPRIQHELIDEPTSISEAAGGHETILLVEDEEGVRRTVHSALERRGYQVLVAGSGDEALDLSRAHQGKIDLLLTDVVMPQMNGRELARIFGQERPDSTVMFISGYPGDTLQLKGVAAPEAAFLAKPFTPLALTRKVRQVLDQHRAQSGEPNTNQASG